MREVAGQKEGEMQLRGEVILFVLSGGGIVLYMDWELGWTVWEKGSGKNASQEQQNTL